MFTIGALVICSLQVIADGGGIPVLATTQLEGKVLRVGQIELIIDFSKDAKRKGIPDPELYADKIIDQNKCVEN